MQELWAAEGITYGYEPDVEAALARRLKGPFFLVAEADGLSLGYAFGSARAGVATAVSSDGAPYLEIEDVYVEPSARRAGVGGLLVEELVKAAAREGLRHVTVYSATKDVRAVLRFYEGRGFSPWFVQLFRDL